MAPIFNTLCSVTFSWLSIWLCASVLAEAFALGTADVLCNHFEVSASANPVLGKVEDTERSRNEN